MDPCIGSLQFWDEASGVRLDTKRGTALPGVDHGRCTGRRRELGLVNCAPSAVPRPPPIGELSNIDPQFSSQGSWFVCI